MPVSIWWEGNFSKIWLDILSWEMWLFQEINFTIKHLFTCYIAWILNSKFLPHLRFLDLPMLWRVLFPSRLCWREFHYTARKDLLVPSPKSCLSSQMGEYDQQLHCNKTRFFKMWAQEFKKGGHLVSKLTQVKAKFPCIPHLMVDQVTHCHQNMWQIIFWVEFGRPQSTTARPCCRLLFWSSRWKTKIQAFRKMCGGNHLFRHHPNHCVFHLLWY